MNSGFGSEELGSEGFCDLLMCDWGDQKSPEKFRPHPGPLPQERGNLRPFNIGLQTVLQLRKFMGREPDPASEVHGEGGLPSFHLVYQF